jgi:hypothetical protein
MGVKHMKNTLWLLVCDLADLPKPDILHTVQLGMLKHLLDWIHDFLRKYDRLASFNAIWLSIQSYLNMTRRTKVYEEISQCTGKELKTISRFRVSCLESALSGASNSERPVFEKAILCTRALCDFYMYC